MSTNVMPRSFEFNDIVESLKAFMISVNEFRDVNWEGSAATALLRALAYNTQMQQVGNNFLFNELDITTATKRSSVAAIASGSLGYLPGSKTCSKLIVDIVVEPSSLPAPSQITLSRNTTFFAAKDGQAYNFSPAEDHVAAYDNGFYRFIDIQLLQGDWVSEAWPVQTEFGLESYTISNQNIDIETLVVGVLPSSSSTSVEKYKRVQSIYDLGPDEKSYFIRINQNGNYVIEFGDDRLCRKLRFGEVVVVDYMTTSGPEGDGIKDINLAGDVGGYYDVTTTLKQDSSTGGGLEEDIESIRRAAPMAFAGQGSAVSPKDFVILIKKLLPGSVVASWGGEDNDPPKPGFQVIAVRPKGSESLSTAQKNTLTQEITKYCVGSVSPFFVDPDFTYIDVTSTILYLKGKTVLDTRALRTKVVDGLRKYSASKLEFFGSDFIYSNLVGWINSIDPSFYGNVTNIKFKKYIKPELAVSRSYSLNFNVKIAPGSVYVDNFTILDSDFDGWSYHISDNGSGALKLIKNHTDGRAYTFSGDYGTVDYETGKVSVDKFRPIKYGDNGVRITIDPSGTDPSMYTSGKSILQIDKIDLGFEDRAST